MTKEIEEELEEYDTIQPIHGEPGYPTKPPFTGGHLPFGEMGITPPPKNRVMGMCNVTFYQLKKNIVQQRRRCFPNNPQNLVSVSTKKVITANIRRNP